MGNVQNIQIKPMKILLGQDLAQVQAITCVADMASSLNNKYFLFHDSAGAKHYAWFNVASAGADPIPAGSWTAHVVAIAANASAVAVATALAAVLTAVTGFDATATNAVVELTHTATGYAQPARDSTIAGTGFGFAVTSYGDTETDGGYTDGDFELSGLSQTVETITAHQTGKVELGEVITGYSKPELGLTFKETDKESLKQYLIRAGSSTYTPEGVGKTEVVGYGPQNVGRASITRRVRLHPVSKDAADKTQDVVFWKASLNIDKFNFSGEKFSLVPVKMPIYPDTTKPASSQYFIIGDPANV